MLLNELEKKYYILAPVTIDNKKIVICSNKADCSFDYFETKNNMCFDVDSSIREKLDSMLKRPYTGFKYIFVSRNMTQRAITQYSKLITECIDNIKNEINSFDHKSKKIILENLNNVKVIEMNQLPTEYKNIVPPNAKALYIPAINTIVLPNFSEHINTDELRYYTQHELLHCASNFHQDPQVGGFMDLSFSTNQTTPIIISQIMINEIFTEVVNNKIFDQHYNGRPKDITISYDVCRLLTKVLFDEINYDSAKLSYFENYPEVFIQYLMGKFHVSNIEVFYKLFLQLDVCNLIEVNVPANSLYESSNLYLYYECLQECCKTIMDIVINKYVCENKSLDSLTIDSFLPNDNFYNNLPPYSLLKTSKQLRNYLESAKLCIKHLRKCSHLDFDEKTEDYKNTLLTIVSYVFAFKPLPDDDIFEQVKSAELFLSIINDKVFLFNTTSNSASVMDIKKSLAFVMDPQNNYLPKNKGKAIKLVEKMLLAKNSYPFDIVDCIPKEYIVEACNINNSLFRSFLPKYLGLFISNIESLNDKNLLDVKFFNKIIQISKTINNENALKFMFKYYKSISLQKRTEKKFQQAFLNVLLVEICKNEENELYKKIKDVLQKEYDKCNNGKDNV